MDTIPPVYWMVLISVVSVFICLILYYIAMLVKETTNTMVEVKEVVRETRDTITKTNKILDESTEVLASAKRTTLMIESSVSELNQSIVQPVKRIGSIISSVSNFVEGFKK